MTDLERALARSLEAVVVKLELELEAIQAITPGRPIPCACDSMRAGPGCKPCLVKRARKVLAEYEAAQNPHPFDSLFCDTCGKADPDITVQYAFDGTRTATCRACHIAATNAREYEREKAGVV